MLGNHLSRIGSRFCRSRGHLGCQFLALGILIGFVAGFSSAFADPETAQYLSSRTQGFQVFVSPEMVKEPTLLKKTMGLLNQKLEQVRTLLKPDQLARLQNVKIWIEKNKTYSATEFHSSRQWLVENKYNPDKENSIEISNAQNFLDWATTDQPLMLLHEFAHAYMFIVLGEDYAPLEKAWVSIRQTNLYASVPYIRGGRREAYAHTNRNEYFAELSEAYFGKNDFFPYDINDLKSYDPAGFKLMESVWGKRDGLAIVSR